MVLNLQNRRCPKPPKAISWIRVLALALGLVATLQAGDLVWDQTQLDLSPEPEQKEISGSYGFHNGGTKPVTILSVDTGCGCTKAELSTKTLKPGETGALSVTFLIGDRKGLQEKRILIQTDDAPSPSSLLLKVHVPTYFAIEPRFVAWAAGDAGDRTIVCTAGSSKEMTVLSAVCSLKQLEIRIETVEAGRKYLLHLHPNSVGLHGSGTLEITAAINGVGQRTAEAYVYVR